MKICYAVMVVLVLLSGCSGSGSSAVSTNNYANGFMLVRLADTLNFSSDDRTSITDYEYDFANREIIVTRTPADQGDEPTTSKLDIDRAGRLVGGSYFSSLGSLFSGTTTYDINYDSEGRVIEYRESELDRFEFNYLDGNLDNIVYFLSNSVWTYRFAYNAQGMRISSRDGVTSETTHFQYNAAGQISSAQVIDQFGRELFSYVFTYDSNGNHVSTLAYTPSGTLFSTRLYTYEASPSTVFNHGIMRQKIEPFEATFGRYVR